MLLAAVWGITKNRRTRVARRGMVRRRGRDWRSPPSPSGRWRNGDVGMGIFTGYIALILVTTGRGMDQRIALRDRLEQGHVGDAMRPPPPTIPATSSLAEALDHALRGTTDQPFPVVDESGRLIGSVSMRSARRVGGRDPLASGAGRPDPVEPDHGPRSPRDPRRGVRMAGRSGRPGGGRREAGRGRSARATSRSWYRRVIEGRSTPTGFAALPPRPDL